MASTASALPDDIDTLKAMLVAMAAEKAELETEAGQLRDETAELKAEVVRLATLNERAEERITNLHAIIKQLERTHFGRSSEKLDDDQQAFAFDEVQTGLGMIEAELDAARPTGEPRRASRPRKAFPAHLERVEIVIEPDTVTCSCGECQPVQIGEDISERLDVTPAKFRVIVTRRPKYGCAQCKEGISQAPAPAHLVEAGVPSEALLAHVAVSKYVDGPPLYRQEGIYARDGVEISRNTIANWMGHVGFHLAPLADRILALIKEGERVYADETTLPTLSRDQAGRNWPGYGPMRGTIELLAAKNRPRLPTASRTAVAASVWSAISPVTPDCSRSTDGAPTTGSQTSGAPIAR